MTHPTIVATRDLHLIRTDRGYQCLACALTRGHDKTLAAHHAPAHLDAHRARGHHLPEEMNL